LFILDEENIYEDRLYSHIVQSKYMTQRHDGLLLPIYCANMSYCIQISRRHTQRVMKRHWMSLL